MHSLTLIVFIMKLELLFNIPSIFAAFVKCQAEPRSADVSSVVVNAEVGSTVNLLCSFNANISSCNFDVPGFVGELKLNSIWDKSDNPFFYHGDGLDKGQCGVTIKNVQINMTGNAVCRLDINDGKSDATGKIFLNIFDPFANRSMVTSDANKASDVFRASCPLVRGDQNVTWFLNNKEIKSEAEVKVGFNDNSSTIQFSLKPEHDKSLLVCRVYHEKFVGSRQDLVQKLVVNFMPMSSTSDTDYEINPSAPTLVSVSFEANPKPDILWFIDGIAFNPNKTEKFIINQLTNEGKNQWNASLQVKESGLEASKVLSLQATNDFGRLDFSLNLTVPCTFFFFRTR